MSHQRPAFFLNNSLIFSFIYKNAFFLITNLDYFYSLLFPLIGLAGGLSILLHTFTLVFCFFQFWGSKLGPWTCYTSPLLMSYTPTFSSYHGLAYNLISSCLSLLSSGIRDVRHHTHLYWLFERTLFLDLVILFSIFFSFH
jgi:hypothetical protein